MNRAFSPTAHRAFIQGRVERAVLIGRRMPLPIDGLAIVAIDACYCFRCRCHVMPASGASFPAQGINQYINNNTSPPTTSPPLPLPGCHCWQRLALRLLYLNTLSSDICTYLCFKQVGGRNGGTQRR